MTSSSRWKSGFKRMRGRRGVTSKEAGIFSDSSLATRHLSLPSQTDQSGEPCVSTSIVPLFIPSTILRISASRSASGSFAML